VPIHVWLSLLVFVVVIGVTLAIAVVRGLAAWRAFNSFQARTDYALLELEQNVDAVEARLEEVEHASARLAAAQSRLQESLATAAVLADAAGEARVLLRNVRGVFPTK
jgi:hypothetical protein